MWNGILFICLKNSYKLNVISVQPSLFVDCGLEYASCANSNVRR